MLQLTNVTAGYESQPVLHDVTLFASANTVTGIIGPNGAGKTSLLRVVSGVIGPMSGTRHFEGTDVTGLSSHRLAQRGLVHIPEGRGIFPSLTVRENLLLQAAKGTERAHIDRALEAFPALVRLLERQARTLSGGEQQMVALSRAYTHNARVVVVDEPSLGLAPAIVDAIFSFIYRIKSTGVSLIIVEQYVQRILEVADYVYVMSQGRIAGEGTREDMARRDLAHHYLGAL